MSEETIPVEKESISDQDALVIIDGIFKQEFDSSQIVREKTWFRNILFYLGEQWIAWFTESNTFGSRYALNPNEPMPVSNVIRDHVKSMKALILNKKYTGRIWPNSKEQKDKDAAELGGMVLKDMDSRNCGESEDIKELCALWIGLTGNAFARTYISFDNGIYITDAKGTVIPRGDVAIESIIPFNVTVPMIGTSLRDKSYVGIKGLKEKEWVEDTFNVTVQSSDAQLVEYEKQLMNLVANVSPWKGRGLEAGSGFDMDVSKYVLFKEVEFRPTRKFPKGRYVASAGGVIVKNEDTMPIPVNDEGEWEYTITDFKYNHTPGSFWATSSIDDLISPQTRINEIDKALSSNRRDVGRPYVLTPKDLVLKRKSLAGQSFLQLEYDPMSAGGATPKVMRGTPYPQQVLEERKINNEVVQNAGGDPKHILRGQSPGSGSSGVMVDMLRESAEMSHTPDIDRFYRSWNRVKKKQIILAQSVFTETRLLKVAGKGNEIIVRSFKGSDLYNNTDVRMELDSGISSTRAGQNQFIMNLIQNRFFGDIAQNPKIQYELMRQFGMSWMPTERSIHEEVAEYENSLVVNATEDEVILRKLDNDVIVPIIEGLFYFDLTALSQGQPPDDIEIISEDPMFKFGDHQIHYDSHVNIILSKEFKTLNPIMQQVLIGHTDIHKWELNAMKQQAMEQMALMQGKAPEPEPALNQPEPQAPPQEGI